MRLILFLLQNFLHYLSIRFMPLINLLPPCADPLIILFERLIKRAGAKIQFY